MLAGDNAEPLTLLDITLRPFGTNVRDRSLGPAEFAGVRLILRALFAASLRSLGHGLPRVDDEPHVVARSPDREKLPAELPQLRVRHVVGTVDTCRLSGLVIIGRSSHRHRMERIPGK